MKDLGRAFGCVERCFCHKHWLDILCTRNVFFFLFEFLIFLLFFFLWLFCFVTFAIWGMWLYRGNVRLFEVSIFICLQTIFRKHGKHKNYIDTLFALEHFLYLDPLLPTVFLQMVCVRVCVFGFFFSSFNFNG